MLVAALDPELYLKSHRTQRRMLGILADNIDAAFDGRVAVHRLAGHRLHIETEEADPVGRLTSIFGIRAVERVDRLDATDFEELCSAVTELFADRVRGQTFAIRAHRNGKHDWSSQDLAVRSGDLLRRSGGRVDLTAPEVEVPIRVVGADAYVTLEVTPGVGGFPLGTQGRALMMFSGGIDSPVAAYMMKRRGVALDYLHFSMGCGQADHAAGIAHYLQDRFGAGTDPLLHVVDLEPAMGEIGGRVEARNRQIALKALMYRCAESVARSIRGTWAVVNGESLGQVSTQTLDHMGALDGLVRLPMLRPLLALDKVEIRHRAQQIGTYDASARTRELCDISGGARVAVSTRPRALAAIADDLADLVEGALATTKQVRLADWFPGED